MKKYLHSVRAAILAIGVLIGLNPPLRAGDADDIQQLRQQIQALQEKLNVLARKQEIADENAATAAKAVPKAALNDNGFTFSDGANSIHIGAVVQLDSREFFGDGGGILNNSFILRRARIVLDGKLDKIYSFQFVPEFGNGSGGTATAVGILDANVGIALSPALQFKLGKFKTPIGLEELQKDPLTFFAERTLVCDLIPNRDLGVTVGGVLGNGTVAYTVGLMNGTPDSLTSSGNSDFDNDKDLAGQIFLTPFVNDRDSAWQGLGIGLGGSTGRGKTHSAATGGYKTDGQQNFFTYNSAVYSDGRVWRLSPQAYYFYGPFGALAEYAISAVNLRPTAPTSTVFPAKLQVENKAWEATATWLLTGEDASYTGVTPNQPFSLANGTWGAWQLVARYANLKIDPNAFRGSSPLASPSANANQASSFGLGFNWYLTKAVRLQQDFFETRFDVTTPTAATPQVLLHNEKALITRLQIAF